ncbi:MAG TPA: DsbA family protein, partial [Minicystis sp.]|nr:DsbA family protein [Minicystis sp.]
LPLPMHQNAELAAEAAAEAYAQRGAAGFWAFHDALFADQRALDRQGLDKVAAGLGLDMAKFDAALDGHTHASHVESDAKLASSLGITGTPGVTVNGYLVSGAQPLAKFKRVVALAMKSGPAPAGKRP